MSRLLGISRTSAEVYPLLSWTLVVRIGGALWLIGAAAPTAVLPFAPPTHVVGKAGWLLAAAIVLIALLSGLYLLARPGRVGHRELLAMGYAGAAGLAIGQSLTGPAAQFGLPFVVLMAFQAAVHPARRVLPLLGCAILAEAASTFVDRPTPLSVVQMCTIVLLIVLITGMALMYAESNRSLTAQLIRLHEDAEQRALTDSLTGLPNRRAFEDALAQHVEASARYRQPLSLAMLDIDDFKSINDRFGHDVGDDALVAVATAIANAVRRPDACFRWGGDEFALLLPDTRRDSAETVIQRVGEAVRGGARLPSGQRISVGAGVATLRVGEQAGELLERADDRLLEAKRGGPSPGQHPAAA